MKKRFGFIKIDGASKGASKRNMFIDEFISKENLFLKNLKHTALSDLVDPLKKLLRCSDELTYHYWVDIFVSCWSTLQPVEKHDMVKHIIVLLAREYHCAQVNLRPNVIQAILDGACRTSPPIQLPPQLVKYLGKTFNAWHIAFELLENFALDESSLKGISSKDEEKIRDSFLDALSDLYSELHEEDYFAGLWRRRCLFVETNIAISCEQGGLWEESQKYYEIAQTRARSCVLPFTESEYNLWEKRWVKATERLQQWDILCDLSKHESNPQLLLECAWRLSDWNTDRDSLSMTLQSIAHPPTPRKKLFQSYLVLNRLGEGQEAHEEFQKLCEDGMQLILAQWHSLPRIVGNSHIPTFHAFQQFVELHEASTIQNNLRGTNSSNIETKSQELKNYLSTWRDRLPNTWDDMNIWSDLVAWRQHVFTAVNKAYLPLIPHINTSAATPTSSYAYRGYHETAWIINRFAHVARKHRLPDVCINFLSKIYTLPNIEIQEAFYKLREQAKCHKDVLGEYSAALDVINNTNLVYFTNSQKAEFFNLRGTFFAKLSLEDKAKEAFSSAIQVDPTLPHSWGSFGEFNDRLFDESPTELKYAADAINCYLHASAIFNNGRCRRMLSRILWLLSMDDERGTLMKVCDTHKAEHPVWYWITFIPELIGSLAGREAKFAKTILVKIAKANPQALHFQLRTAKEDFIAMKKQSQSSHGRNAGTESKEDVSNSEDNVDVDMEPAEKREVTVKDEASGGADEVQNSKPSVNSPWDNIEDIMSMLKTAFPLLALTMETLVDQILARLKPSTDEDIYRLIVALLNDGVQVICCSYRCIYPICLNSQKQEVHFQQQQNQV
jgi:transformation/transcription domain-associated protein